MELMFSQIKSSLHEFSVDFDVFFHEDSLFQGGQVETLLEQLRSSDSLYFEDGAWWLRYHGARGRQGPRGHQVGRQRHLHHR
ncbi:hypothetical protein QJS66_00065 [Kocuria rhizophila]|nr:hypothetical protein QJS66_00065 [Kocuria rhizophila]